MKSNREIRREAWDLLWHQGGLQKLVGMFILFTAMSMLVSLMLDMAYTSMSIVTLNDFLVSKLQAARNGLDYQIPSSRALVRMVLATGFWLFVVLLSNAITSIGMARATVRVATGAKECLVASLVGFRYPFAALWQSVLLQLRILGYGCWFLLPCILSGVVLPIVRGEMPEWLWWIWLTVTVAWAVAVVAFLACWLGCRYGFVWFLKSEAPTLSAGTALKGSVLLMRGHIRSLLALYCSYWRVLLLPMLVLAVGVVIGRNQGQLTIFSLLFLVSGVFAFLYVALGHAIFYRETKAEAEKAHHHE